MLILLILFLVSSVAITLFYRASLAKIGTDFSREEAKAKIVIQADLAKVEADIQKKV